MNYWNVSVFCNVKETHRAQPVAQQLYRLHSANQRRQHIGELVSRWNLFHCHQVTLNMDFYICQPQMHTHTHFKQIHLSLAQDRTFVHFLSMKVSKKCKCLNCRTQYENAAFVSILRHIIIAFLYFKYREKNFNYVDDRIRIILITTPQSTLHYRAPTRKTSQFWRQELTLRSGFAISGSILQNGLITSRNLTARKRRKNLIRIHI